MNPHDLRAQIQARMLAALPHPTQAERAELAEYARMLRDYPERGGKMLRGMLLVYSGLAFGAKFERLLPVAAALELFQNWALIHDDIEDASEERRGRPALHRLYGVPLALNAGDALHARMWAMLIEARAPYSVLDEFVRVVDLTAQGQHLEMSWMQGQRFDLTEQDYLLMCSQKAAYYTAVAPLRLGALSAGEEPPEVYTEAGLNLGIGFQIMDDVLNLEGDPAKYGKEIAGDLWEGKRTLILLHWLSRASEPERIRAETLLRTPREAKNPQEVAWLHRRLQESGAVAYAREEAERRLSAGLEALRPILAELPEQDAAQTTLQLLERLVRREA